MASSWSLAKICECTYSIRLQVVRPQPNQTPTIVDIDKGVNEIYAILEVSIK